MSALKMIFERLLCVVAIALPLAVFAQQTTTPADAQKYQQAAKKYSFKAMDVSGDKKVSRAEAKTYGVTDAEFTYWDKDNSGFITWDEINTYWGV
jgi:hypothetical protein